MLGSLLNISLNGQIQILPNVTVFCKRPLLNSCQVNVTSCQVKSTTGQSEAGKTSEPAVKCTNVSTQTDVVVDIEEISQEEVEQEEEQAVIKLGLVQYDSGCDESDGDSVMGESDFSVSDF